MNPSPPEIPTGTVIISGITIDLTKPLKRPILVELSINKTDSRSVLLKPEENPIGEHMLHAPLNLPDKSILSIRVQEKHRLRADKSLAHTNVSLDNIWPMQELATHGAHPKKYQIRLSDPDYQLWLNVLWVSLSSQSRSDDVGQTSQVVENVPRAQEQAEESLKSASHNAVQKLRDFKTAIDHLGRAKNPVETMMNFGMALSGLNPIAKAVVASVHVLYDQMKTQAESHQEILTLAENLERIVDHIQPVKNIAKLDALKKTLETFPELMKETAELIEKFVGQNGFVNFVLTPYNKEKIDDLKKRHAVFQQEFDRGIKIDGAVKMNAFIELQELKELEDRLLGKVKFVDPRSTECIEGTRTRILTQVNNRTDDYNGSNIIWIRGAPGCGKSSISLTTKSRLRRLGRLITYFRFDRNEAATTTSNALWRCVAYDLARRLPAVRPWLLQQLRDDKVDLDSSVAIFTSLVEASLSELTDSESLPNCPLVIVVDALDECGGLEGRSSLDRKALLQTLGRWSKLPKHFKLLVTGREESDIAKVLSGISSPVHILSGHFLTEDPEDEASVNINNDIHMFLTGRFRDISKRSPLLPTDWPGTKIITEMVNRAAGIFLWATAAAHFIESGIDPRGRLLKIMGDVSESNLKPLYSLYTTILEMSFGDISSNGSEAEALRSVLGTMVLARRPLNDVEYTKLPTTEPVTGEILDFIRDGLRSVIAPGALRFIHKSFDDFLLSEDCPPKFAIWTRETHHLLAKLSLKTMITELRFNICDLETSCLPNVDMPDIETRVTNGISALLSYSCCYWADHLSCTSLSEQLMGLVKEFIFEKLLSWYEAMSLLNSINRVSYSLLSVLNWAKPVSDEKLNDFIRDARRFIGAFGRPISQSAPHIYISALPFAPQYSLVARHFLPQFPRILAVSEGKPTNWSPCVFTSEHHTSNVCSVAFSPDEKYFVSGSHDQTICICDSQTGNLVLGPLAGTNQVTSCFFAPDGRRVWVLDSDDKVTGWDVETGDKHVEFQAGIARGDVLSFCCSTSGREIITTTRQGTVALWNADTGEQLSDILKLWNGHTYGDISFSPDSGYIAWARTKDTAVRIQKLEDGNEIRCQPHSQPHFSQATPITALTFSVDGDTVVSGLKDGTIFIWDAKTGDVIGRPLDTGREWVRAVAYSHETNILVSASGDPGTVMVWNAKTHELVLGPLEGHTLWIDAITLSQDGRRVLTASGDETVRMWDLGKKGAVPVTDAIEGHTAWVWCVAFSPCGKMLASVDYQTIRLWDASTGKSLLNPITNPSAYNKVTFSPDNTIIVAYGSTLQAWYVNTGEPAFDLESDVEHAAFRSTDQRLVTFSYDGVIRIWSWEDGSLSENLSVSSPQPEDPTKPVKILALLANGLTAIVHDKHRSSQHYMWNTTTCQPLPLTFVDDEDILGDEVAYSPSGKFFAAASEHGTLRVWNSQTGELSAGPLTLNDQFTNLAFSPDDCHIAFSYYSEIVDQTEIWIWNAKSCCMDSGPWKAHTDRIIALAFSSDGGKLASGSKYGQVGIWNTADLLGHSGASSGFLDVGTRMEDGWVTDTSGNMLFWVPKDNRSGLVWSQNIGIVIGGEGIHTELDLTRFRYGEKWTECSEEEQ